MERKISFGRRMKKCCLLLFAAVCLFAAQPPGIGEAASKEDVIDSGTMRLYPWNEEEGNYTYMGDYYAKWKLTADGVLSIEGDGEIVFGQKIPWEDNKEKITRAEIGEGIINILENSFSDCPNLTTVIFPSTFNNYGDHCLKNCPSLKELIYANGRQLPKTGSISLPDPSYVLDEDNQVTIYYTESKMDSFFIENGRLFETFEGYVKEIRAICGYKDGQMILDHQSSGMITEEIDTPDARIRAFDAVEYCVSCGIGMSREHHICAAGEEITGYEYVPFSVDLPSKKEILDFIREHPADVNAPVKYKTKPSKEPPYSAGVLSQETRQQLTNLVNQIRFLAGVDANVQYSAEKEKYAASASLAMALNRSLTHYIRRPSVLSGAEYDELYDNAVIGGTHSNLGGGSPSINYNVLRYLDDKNTPSVGHRRHILKGNLTDVGIAAGMVDTYSAMYIMDIESSGEQEGQLAQVAWPANLTPNNYWYTGALWSVCWGSDIEGDTVSVVMKKNNGKKEEFTMDNYTVGVDGGTVLFSGAATKKDGESYTIFVKNETKKQMLVYHAGFFETEATRTSIQGAKVVLSASNYTYDGKGKKPFVKKVVLKDGRELLSGIDYKVTYKNNTDAGTAKVVVTGIGNYSKSVSKTFQIKKASPRITVNRALFYQSAFAKKAGGTAITVSPKKKTGITYRNASPSKLKKYISVDKKGKVTFKKKAPAGTYVIKVIVSKGKNHKKATETIRLYVVG